MIQWTPKPYGGASARIGDARLYVWQRSGDDAWQWSVDAPGGEATGTTARHATEDEARAIAERVARAMGAA